MGLIEKLGKVVDIIDRNNKVDERLLPGGGWTRNERYGAVRGVRYARGCDLRNLDPNGIHEAELRVGRQQVGPDGSSLGGEYLTRGNLPPAEDARAQREMRKVVRGRSADLPMGELRPARLGYLKGRVIDLDK